MPIDWRAAVLQRELDLEWPGLGVQVLDSVASTNTHLLDHCRADEGAPRAALLLVAEQQSAGRGRQGRRWHSARGDSLTFSLAVPLQGGDASGLSLAVGVALADALDPSAPNAARLMLKWPNDLWLVDAPGESRQAEQGQIAGRKLGGVLVETLNRGAHRVAVIGIGLNVRRLAVPDPSSGVACLQEINPRLSVSQALHRVARPLVQALRQFEREGFAAFEARFRDRDLLFGRAVTAGQLEGVAQGVARSGALRLRCGQGLEAAVHEVVSGEVSVRLTPESQPDPVAQPESSPDWNPDSNPDSKLDFNPDSNLPAAVPRAAC